MWEYPIQTIIRETERKMYIYGFFWQVHILDTESESRGRECWIFWISFQIFGIYPPNRIGLKILIILLQVEKRALIVHGCVLAIQIHKIVTFSPNQPLIRSTELSDSIWYIWVFLKKKKKKLNKYRNIDWLLLMSLGKVVQEESELRNSISQHKGHREDLRASLWIIGDSYLL